MTQLRRNAIANLAGRAVTGVLWVAVTPYVLSRLGAERFGIWSLFFTFLSYLLAFDLGISSTMTRFVASARGAGESQSLLRTLRRGLMLAIGLGLLWAAVVVLARPWIVHVFRVPPSLIPETQQALVMFAAAVLILFPTQVMMGSLQGFERIDLSNLCLVSGVATQVVALYFGLATHNGLQAAAMAGVAGQLVSGVMAAVMLRREFRKVALEGAHPGPSWRDMMQFGAALQLAGFLIVLQLQLGKIVLGVLGNLTMVSEYEVAFRVANAVGSLPVLVMLSVIPAASRAWESEGHKAIVPLFISTSRWVYTHTVITLGLLWLLAQDIAHVWLGPGHEHIAFLIQLWAVAYAIILAWGPGTVIARGIGMPWLEVWGLGSAVLANLALSYWWVPRFGSAGAVAALGASFVVAFTVFVATFHRRSRIPFGPWFGRELIPRALAGVLTVGSIAWLLTINEVARRLPAPGWKHGAIVTALFVAIFAIGFAPLGDTQRLHRTAWQMVGAAWARRRPVTAS